LVYLFIFATEHGRKFKILKNLPNLPKLKIAIYHWCFFNTQCSFSNDITYRCSKVYLQNVTF